MNYKLDHHKDVGYVKIKEWPSYKPIKGYLHIWTYFTTDESSFICSKYTKSINNGLYSTTITNTSKGWRVHLFFGGAKFKSWFYYYYNLKDAVEQCELYLNGKLILY